MKLIIAGSRKLETVTANTIDELCLATIAEKKSFTEREEVGGWDSM